jgi:hypothetical protein
METISRRDGYASSESRRAALVRLAWRLDTPAGLTGVFALALVVRLALAPYAGFYEDLYFLRLWAARLAAVGPHHFYVPGLFQWQSPGYLYFLWLIGKISSSPSYLLLKLPSILADLGLAWVVGTFADRLAPSALKERLPVRALVATTVLFNPAVFAVSAVWGQVDSIPTLLLVSALLLLFTGRHTVGRDVSAFLLFALSLAVKPQAIFVLPVMVYALYRRYLRGRSGAELGDGLLATGVIGVTSLGLWALTGLPFGLDPAQLVRFNRQWAGIYPFTSLNAFNLWGIVEFRRNDANTNDPTAGHVFKVAGVPAQYVGWILFLIALGYILWRTHRALGRGADEQRMLTMAAAVAALAGYLLLTRDHERYLFLPLMLLAPFVFVRSMRRWYALLCGLFVVNLWFAFAYFNSRYPAIEDLRFQPWFGWLFGGLHTTTQTRLWSAAVSVVALVVAYRGMRWAETAVAPTTAGAGAAADIPPAKPIAPPAPARPLFELPESWTRWFAAVAAERDLETTRTARWGPRALVGLACLLGLVGLRAETTSAPNLNDSAFHLQMVRWAIGQMHEGRIPLDGWFPYLSLGSSFFHHYQSLSETITAFIAYATGASASTIFLWLLYLLLSLWPISVYFGARLLGWERWVAASAAAVAPLLFSAPGYGYETGSYTYGGYGVYTQLWAMWTLPLAWGLTWQAVTRGRRLTAAVVALALTMALHFITGYLAVLIVGVWVIVLGTSGFMRRVGRFAIVVGASMLVASWVLVPLLGDTKWTTQSEYYIGTIFNDSYGAQKELGWLIRGSLFDYHRFPIVTLLFFVGLIVCGVTARRDLRARALLGAFALGMLLWFGRPTWGRLLNLLPGFGDVQIHRFVIGVDLAGILIAGVGLSWLVRAGFVLARRRVPGRRAIAVGAAVGVAVAIGVLAPAWVERYHYARHDAVYIDYQRSVDPTAGAALDHLIAIIKARGGGRVYAGLRSNWGVDYKVGDVPVNIWLADHDVDAIGFTFRTINSLSTDVEAAFDETNPAQYQMFDIRYLLLPVGHQPPVPAKLIASSGGNRLYQVKTSGYFQVVDRSAPIAENRTDIEQQSKDWRTSRLALQNIYPGVAFAGAAGPPPTFSGAKPPPGAPGRVVVQSERLQDGVFDATVRVRRPSVVLLKASYDPRWTATVDGVATKPVMMAPSLVGVDVPPGTHVVHFHYESYPHYPELLGVGALTLLGLVFVPRFLRRRRRRGEAAPEPR